VLFETQPRCEMRRLQSWSIGHSDQRLHHKISSTFSGVCKGCYCLIYSIGFSASTLFGVAAFGPLLLTLFSAAAFGSLLLTLLGAVAFGSLLLMLPGVMQRTGTKSSPLQSAKRLQRATPKKSSCHTPRKGYANTLWSLSRRAALLPCCAP